MSTTILFFILELFPSLPVNEVTTSAQCGGGARGGWGGSGEKSRGQPVTHGLGLGNRPHWSSILTIKSRTGWEVGQSELGVQEARVHPMGEIAQGPLFLSTEKKSPNLPQSHSGECSLNPYFLIHCHFEYWESPFTIGGFLCVKLMFHELQVFGFLWPASVANLSNQRVG